MMVCTATSDFTAFCDALPDVGHRYTPPIPLYYIKNTILLLAVCSSIWKICLFVHVLWPINSYGNIEPNMRVMYACMLQTVCLGLHFFF